MRSARSGFDSQRQEELSLVNIPFLDNKKRDIDHFQLMSDAIVQVKYVTDDIIDQGANMLYEIYLETKISEYLSDYMTKMMSQLTYVEEYPHDDNVPIYPYRTFFEDVEPALPGRDSLMIKNVKIQEKNSPTRINQKLFQTEILGDSPGKSNQKSTKSVRNISNVANRSARNSNGFSIKVRPLSNQAIIKTQDDPLEDYLRAEIAKKEKLIIEAQNKEKSDLEAVQKHQEIIKQIEQAKGKDNYTYGYDGSILPHNKKINLANYIGPIKAEINTKAQEINIRQHEQLIKTINLKGEVGDVKTKIPWSFKPKLPIPPEEEERLMKLQKYKDYLYSMGAISDQYASLDITDDIIQKLESKMQLHILPHFTPAPGVKIKEKIGDRDEMLEGPQIPDALKLTDDNINKQLLMKKSQFDKYKLKQNQINDTTLGDSPLSSLSKSRQQIQQNETKRNIQKNVSKLKCLTNHTNVNGTEVLYFEPSKSQNRSINNYQISSGTLKGELLPDTQNTKLYSEQISRISSLMKPIANEITEINSNRQELPKIKNIPSVNTAHILPKPTFKNTNNNSSIGLIGRNKRFIEYKKQIKHNHDNSFDFANTGKSILYTPYSPKQWSKCDDNLKRHNTSLMDINLEGSMNTMNISDLSYSTNNYHEQTLSTLNNPMITKVNPNSMANKMIINSEKILDLLD